MTKEIIGYYQSNIHTSRDENSVYAMTYANQQLLIDKLQQENQKYKEAIDKAVEYIEKHLTDNGRFLMLNEWQVPDLLRILKEVE